jgi:hypothetical protein
MKLRAEDSIEVKSKEENFRTLDMKGQLEGMPFMPQMFRFCGQRFNVYKRAQNLRYGEFHKVTASFQCRSAGSALQR